MPKRKTIQLQSKPQSGSQKSHKQGKSGTKKEKITLESLLKQAATAQEENWSKESISSFNLNFCIFLQVPSTLRKILSPFAAQWRSTYLHAIEGQNFITDSEHKPAIACYQKQVKKLSALAKALPKEHTDHLRIIQHTIAYAFHEMGMAYQLQYEQLSKTRAGATPKIAIELLNEALQCYQNGLKAYPKAILEQGAKADDKAKESEFRDFSLGGTIFERITALKQNIEKTASLLKKYTPITSLLVAEEPDKQGSKKRIASKPPILEALLTQSKSLETADVSEQQIKNFNERFWHYTQRQVEPMLNSKLAAYWRTAYLYSVQASEYAENEAFDEAIECYETQIQKLTTGPILSARTADSFLIRRHEIAKAYYQMGVLYTQKYKHLTESFDEESDDEIPNTTLLHEAQQCYEKGIECYSELLPPTPGSTLKTLKPITREFDCFSNISVQARLAALHFNLGAIEETLSNEGEVQTHDTSFNFRHHFKEAYEFIQADPHPPEKLKQSIENEYAYFFERDHKQKNPRKRTTPPGKRKKHSPQKPDASYDASELEMMDSDDALRRFCSIDIDAFVAKQKDDKQSNENLTVLRPHQIAHLKKLQQKLLADPSCREAGVISATGSGKTMVMKTFIHLLYPDEDTTAIRQRIPIITVVPTQSLVAQDADKTSCYRENGLDHLSSDKEIGKWFAGEKRLRPHTVITYQSLVSAANRSVEKYPTQKDFDDAIEDNADKMWTDPNLFFSPFNKSIVFFDEAHTSESETRLATYARYAYPDKQEYINQFFVDRNKRLTPKKQKSTAPAPMSLSSSNSTFLAPMATESERVELDHIKLLFKTTPRQPKGFIYSTTATPSSTHHLYFPIDSEYGISKAIEDGIAPAMQILKISIEDKSLTARLRAKVRKGQRNHDGELNKEVKSEVDKLLASKNIQRFNEALAQIIQALPLKKTIAFRPTVQHVKEFTAIFRQTRSDESYCIEEMHGDNKNHHENSAAEQRFKQAKKGVLINCKMAGLGADYPETGTAFNFHVYMKAQQALLQAAGRILRKKVDAELSKYFWLDLDIGQLDPAETLFGEDHPHEQNYKFAAGTSEAQIQAQLFKASDFPEEIKLTTGSNKVGADGRPLDLLSFTLPTGEKVIYDYAGHKKVQKPEAKAAAELAMPMFPFLSAPLLPYGALPTATSAPSAPMQAAESPFRYATSSSSFFSVIPEPMPLFPTSLAGIRPEAETGPKPMETTNPFASSVTDPGNFSMGSIGRLPTSLPGFEEEEEDPMFSL
jgi:superfamily II DNA or RNA helicase